MARNTMGEFISALRKANGLTQQELADRLNVSNKAVSRWERDESAPDISLIPALAEMLGVTCDELLKGERILGAEVQEKREAKIEKQVRSLVNRTLSRFRMLMRITMTDAIIGLIWMLGICYGFFRPAIGFAVMLLFEAIAIVLAVVALDRAKEVQNESELFAEAGEELTAKFSHQLGSYSFGAFFTIAAVILLSLPLVLLTPDYSYAVMNFESYFRITLWTIVPALVLSYSVLKERCVARIGGGKRPAKVCDPGRKKVRLMSGIQLGLLLAGLLCDVLSVQLDLHPLKEDIGSNIARAASFVLGVGSILCPIVYFIKYKDLRRRILLPGLRNLLMIGPVGAIMDAHYTWWSSNGGSLEFVREITWDWDKIWWALSAAWTLFVVFMLIDALLKRKK